MPFDSMDSIGEWFDSVDLIGDWLAYTFSSPHVAQRFVFSGGPEGASQPELAQLESQRGEWTVHEL